MPISSVWVRGIKKVDIVGSVRYFPGAPFAREVRNTCLGGTGGREGGARRGTAGGGRRGRVG